MYENGCESAYSSVAWQDALSTEACQRSKYVIRPANIHSFKTTFFHTEFILRLSSLAM